MTMKTMGMVVVAALAANVSSIRQDCTKKPRRRAGLSSCIGDADRAWERQPARKVPFRLHGADRLALRENKS